MKNEKKLVCSEYKCEREPDVCIFCVNKLIAQAKLEELDKILEHYCYYYKEEGVEKANEELINMIEKRLKELKGGEDG